MSRRYTESLDDWAHLHGELTADDPGPDTEQCPIHGRYVVRSIIDRECGDCLAQDAADRADAEHDWRWSAGNASTDNY